MFVDLLFFFLLEALSACLALGVGGACCRDEVCVRAYMNTDCSCYFLSPSLLIPTLETNFISECSENRSLELDETLRISMGDEK